VLGEVRKQASVMEMPPNLFHWRSHGGAEVDVVLEYSGRLFPIEITLRSNPGRDKAGAMRAFRDAYPGVAADRGLIIAPVEQPYAVDEGTWVVPWDAEGPRRPV
jgi:hypothetical protein